MAWSGLERVDRLGLEIGAVRRVVCSVHSTTSRPCCGQVARGTQEASPNVLGLVDMPGGQLEPEKMTPILCMPPEMSRIAHVVPQHQDLLEHASNHLQWLS